MTLGRSTTSRIARRALLGVLVVLGVAWAGWGQTTQSATLPLISPTAIVFDGNGALYVAETGRHVVDRLDATGALLGVAGTGTQGFAGDGGVASAAELDAPQGIALDGAGNLYIADTHNHRVRRVAAGTGVITTVAGTGAPGYSGDGGPAVSARLSLPTAVAVDPAGNVYVADSGNQRIRKVSAGTGTIATVAGSGVQGLSGDDGPAGTAALDTPSGLAVNGAGDVYLADFHNGRVRVVARDTGVIRTLGAGIRLPRGLSMDGAGNVYVADVGGHRVVRLSAAGVATVLAGSGTEGFGGDEGPATAALLDGPHGTGVSPAGLVTVADTGNQRIRQVDAAGVIHTLGAAGLAPDSLTLSAPAAVQYGGGTVTATLSGGTVASGAVAFFEVTNGTRTALGSAGLTQDVASFSTGNLPAGGHRLVATYAGDVLHAAASSDPFTLTVNPAPVNAVPVGGSVLYGQTIPALAGSLTGVLARDAGLVSAVFTTTARVLSPAGDYAIGATLTGVAAGNYQIAVMPAVLTILRAPTVTSAAGSASPVGAGTALTLAAKVGSTTQGVPGGRVSFLDGGTALGSGVADGAGSAALTLSTLGVGSHAITAVYGGDGNFLGSTSAGFTEVVTPAAGSSPDFTVAVAGGASQTAVAGAAVSFSFNVAVQNGPLNSPIVLAASGMPPGGTATFSPAYLPPGGGVSAFTLSVQTSKTAAGNAAFPVGLGLLVFGVALLGGRRRGSHWVRLAVVLLGGAAGLGAVAGCGGIQGAALPTKTVTATSYPMTVTATSTLPNGTALQHTAVVTLIVQ